MPVCTRIHNVELQAGRVSFFFFFSSRRRHTRCSRDWFRRVLFRSELQRINQALLLQLRTQQDANQINANLALQQIVAQKQQQDAMKSAFRDSAGYESYYNADRKSVV